MRRGACAQEGFRSQSCHYGGFTQNGVSLAHTLVDPLDYPLDL